jgi:lipid-A-disaccharide synthase
MKYYIIAGEASGDLHGSNLMKALYKEDVDANIRFSGDLMQKKLALSRISFHGFRRSPV